ncbi:MAG TPA: hypothetical protein PKH39_13075 [Woeseiaceae bacterium]|nr:hypothetical protein [Woeseiaceae bacterium]
MAKHNLTLLILGVLSLSLLPGATLAAEPITFNGIGNGQTQNFETNGPWLLDWSVRSDTPLAAKVEMRLLKADSGDFVGRILDLNGIGSGLRLFEEGGRFRITVVASLAEWRIEVTELDKAQADRMKRQSTSGPTFKESIDDALRLVDADSFDGWQTEDNNTLLLLNGDTIRWRVTFRRPCPGLDAATSLSFVTPPAGSLAYYSSILLDDGTRCYFLRVAPYALN